MSISRDRGWYERMNSTELLWQCPQFHVFSGVEDFAMKPLMPFLQRVGIVSRRRPCYGADLTSSETSLQPLIGVKVPSDNVSMIHVGWTYQVRRHWNRPPKKREVNECQAAIICVSCSFSNCASSSQTPAIYSRGDGVIHDKTKCVWCCKTEMAKHPESKLKLISYDHAWASFKSHMVALDGQVMRDRINKAIRDGRPRPPRHQGFIAISYGGSELRHRSILETITHRPKCQIQQL